MQDPSLVFGNMNIYSRKTKKVILIASAILVVLYFIFVIFLSFLPSKKIAKNQETPYPTGTMPWQKQKTYNLISKPAPLSTDDFERLIISVENRREIPTEDAKIREELVAKAQGQTADIYASPAFKIRYVSDANLFQVEILTDDIDYARTEAFKWFSKQGLNTAWLCDLPTIFFKNPTQQKGSRLEIYECSPNSYHD